MLLRHLTASLALLVLVSVFFADVSIARAGGCAVCTTSAECVDLYGPPAFCVEWSDATACGASARICCPGQGCDTFSGRPSCETAGRCRVVDDVDAGVAVDAGMPSDAGMRPDAATPFDGGATLDGGSGDAGGASSMRRDSGCGCRVGGGESKGGAALFALVLSALGLVARRRRR